MFKFYQSALLIITLTTFLVGCTGRNLNLTKVEVEEINNGSKALIVVQTAVTIPDGTIEACMVRLMELKWLNLSSSKESPPTQRYQMLYAPAILNTDIELYLVTPGHYKLKHLKYNSLDHITSYTFECGDIDIAEFSVKGGDVIYIGKLIINVTNITSDKFLKDGLNVQDNYDIAQTYMKKHYPEYSLKLQKRLVRLHKN